MEQYRATCLLCLFNRTNLDRLSFMLAYCCKGDVVQEYEMCRAPLHLVCYSESAGDTRHIKASSMQKSLCSQTDSLLSGKDIPCLYDAPEPVIVVNGFLRTPDRSSPLFCTEFTNIVLYLFYSIYDFFSFL